MIALALCALLGVLQVNFSVSKDIELRGAGASFPSIVYQDWSMMYSSSRAQRDNVSAAYQRIGSGAGLKTIEGVLPDNDPDPIVYAASDADMSPEEQQRYPELVMFPSLAGAVVFIYNLPSINNRLTLNRSAIAGIFLGSIRNWNDSVLRELNPDMALPAEPIMRTFRNDSSGTTEMLTSALSSFSETWNKLHGVSPRPDWGTSPEDGGEKLVNSAAAMAGYVALIPYSFGYLSLSDTETLQPTYAAVINRAGCTIGTPEKIVAGVQDAMNFFHSDQDGQFIRSISDAPTPRAYPVAAYTYIAVNISTSPKVDCAQMVEFVRYVIWFLNDSFARQMAQMNRMVPLSANVAKSIVERVLKQIRCRNTSVYEAMIRQIEEENRHPSSDVSIAIIMLISLAILICVAAPISLFFYNRQRLMKRAINRKEWLIDPDRFQSPDEMRDTSSGVGSSRAQYRSENGDFTTVTWKDESGRAMLHHCAQHSGDGRFSSNTLKFIIKCRQQIKHANVACFVGVTIMDKALYQVYSINDRRTLHQVLISSPYKLNDDIKLNMASAVANGVEYLHRHGIVLGNLSTWTCLLDLSWTIKVTSWAENTMLETERLLRPAIEADYASLDGYPSDFLMRMAFVHPHLLANKKNSYKTTKLGPRIDTYSFGVMLIEIGKRTPIWMGKASVCGWAQCVFDHCRSGAGGIIDEMFSNDGRDRMPLETIQIVSQLLKDDGGSLTFSDISHSLKKATRTKTRGVVDILLSVVEEHANTLDDLLKQKVSETASLHNELDRLLGQVLPPIIRIMLKNGESVQPEQFDSCTVLFANIVSFTHLAHELMPYQAVKILNLLCDQFDHVLDQRDVYKVQTIGDSFMIVSGAPRLNGDFHGREIALTAIAMLACVRNFVIDTMPQRKLAMRLGAHTGPVVAGVVGSKMPRYCLFGDTVKTASRMESSSLPNRIQVSSRTADYLRSFEPEFFVQRRDQAGMEDTTLGATYWLVQSLAENPELLDVEDM